MPSAKAIIKITEFVLGLKPNAYKRAEFVLRANNTCIRLVIICRILLIRLISIELLIYIIDLMSMSDEMIDRLPLSRRLKERLKEIKRERALERARAIERARKSLKKSLRLAVL